MIAADTKKMATENHQWEAGGLCEVNLHGKWVKAEIIDIFNDEEGQRVKVNYDRNTGDLSPNDPYLRPYKAEQVKIDCTENL